MKSIFVAGGGGGGNTPWARGGAGRVLGFLVALGLLPPYRKRQTKEK